MKLSEIGDEILLKNEKIKFCEKSLIFRWQNRLNWIFWRFLGALCPYKSYRVSIRICESKQFNRFFHQKIKLFSQNFIFPFFSKISSPTSESFIAQLPLCRALDKKYFFFSRIREIPIPAFCQCSWVSYQWPSLKFYLSFNIMF